MLLHLEIQSKEDRTMAQRLLEYNVVATREHQCPVLSCVLYLRQDHWLAESPSLADSGWSSNTTV